MNRVPVLLLDVDGVLNVPVKKPPVPWTWADWNWSPSASWGGPFSIGWATPVVEFLTRIHDAGLVEIRWHTTWQADAQSVADLVGLPTFPIADAPEWAMAGRYTAQAIRESRPDWWKLPAAERVVQEEGRPLIWCDDDIHSELARYGWGEYLDDVPVLLVCPEPKFGLEPRHFRRIERFLTLLADGWVPPSAEAEKLT